MLLLEIRAALSSLCHCFGLGCGVKAGSSVLNVQRVTEATIHTECAWPKTFASLFGQAMGISNVGSGLS